MILFGSVLFLLSCSKGHDGDSAAKNAFDSARALPASWYQLPENGGSSDLEETSATADASVRSLFRSHTKALESSVADVSPFASFAAPLGAPSDWVPWHLDGMIATFAVDVSGIFGALLFDGTASVRGIWQQVRKTPAAASLGAGKASSVRFESKMTQDELSARLEPIIQSVVASGKVRDERALRSNLQARGQGFLAACAALEALPRPRGWHVDSFQLQLTIGASGQVTPAIGVGGVLNIFFDWQKQDDAAPVPAAPPAPGLAQNLPAFVRVFQSSLASLPADRLFLRDAGFVMNQFQLGVAVGVGGDIGVARVAAVANGKIIFKADASQLSAAAFEPRFENAAFVSLVSKGMAEEPVAFAAANGIPAETRLNGSVSYKMGADGMSRGLEKALRMASYFARQARRADTRNWKVNLIEAEFDASVTGDLKIATVGGQGQFLLDFNRIDP